MTLYIDPDHTIQPAPLVCSRCDQEFEYIEGRTEYTCTMCGHSIDNLLAQFAYCRGYDAFINGQHIYLRIPPNRRTSQAYTYQVEDATLLFTQAYTAIQEAFLSDLADSQRKIAIDMMASIAVLLMQLNLVSHLEANYWQMLLVEQVNQKELEDINLKLTQPSAGIFSFIARLNWCRRIYQLGKALTRIEKKIYLIEKNIAFVTPPRVRKTTSMQVGR